MLLNSYYRTTGNSLRRKWFGSSEKHFLQSSVQVCGNNSFYVKGNTTQRHKYPVSFFLYHWPEGVRICGYSMCVNVYNTVRAYATRKLFEISQTSLHVLLYVYVVTTFRNAFCIQATTTVKNCNHLKSLFSGILRIKLNSKSVYAKIYSPIL